ncbi:E3 ubiquitin-protein ligase RNF25 [Zerene cesonia]|uniref:E3 ubiquitin-protein ligase RNF25 n=1 Tax=Zerene cesonia TaxID=33412 RepID=UPI0018E51A3C|nr:E3 ubiquitin-protein ligase RNF25 [Zerene cesonia]
MSAAAVDERVYEELQALEAIFAPDIVIKREDGVPKSVEINVLPSTGDKSDEQYVRLTLEVYLTPEYPDSSPKVIMRNPRGLDDRILSCIQSDIEDKLLENIGHLIVYELIEMVRECLTQCNLPRGQCVICLHGFVKGDVFIKTPCFHYFHSQCLSKHFIAGKKYYEEEIDKLPTWQKIEAKPYQQTCPVCRSTVQFNVDELKKAPPPVESIDAQPFHLTDEIRAMQERMAALMAHQLARGGVIGVGDTEPPPLIITDPADQEEPKSSTSGTQNAPKPETSSSVRATGNSNASVAPASPTRPPYRGPYRGFNRRGKPGRRGRGGSR